MSSLKVLIRHIWQQSDVHEKQRLADEQLVKLFQKRKQLQRSELKKLLQRNEQQVDADASFISRRPNRNRSMLYTWICFVISLK